MRLANLHQSKQEEAARKMFGLDEMHADGMSTGLFSDEEDGYNLEEETKYKLKLDAPQSEPAFGDSGSDDLGDFEDLGGDELGGDDKPFDDEPFDAGVEADEVEEPEKYIQQLSGKLGTSLRKYSDERGEPDFDLEKFAINSVISATHTSDMDEEDQRDIIKKVKSSGADDDFGAEDDLGDEESLGDGLGPEDNDEELGDDLGGDDLGLEDELDEVAVRDYEAEEEANKPNLRVYGQNPHAEKYVKEDGFELNELTDLNISEKNDIFTENMNIMDYIKNKVQELMATETKPEVKPEIAPVETPSPRRKRIWEAKPAVQPKPKASK